MENLKNKRITFTVINDLVTDQRVHRSAQTLHEAGASVTLIGRFQAESLPVERDYKTKRLHLLINSGPAFYIFYNIRLFFYLLLKKTDILVAIDLDTLLANYLVSVIRHKKLVYDAHELFTEMPELVNRKRTQKIWLTLEKWILPKIKHSYTVCKSIAEIYNRQYGINMEVVRNVPFSRNRDISNTPLKNLPDKKFVIYQGAVNIGRGLEMFIDAFEHIDDFIGVIAGTGDIIESLRQRVAGKKLGNKIFILGRLPLDELHHLTCNAALGVSIEEHLGMNYYFALPNKLFDYIQARVPVLVSDLPEMKNIVETYQIGEVVESRSPKAFANQMKRMFMSSDRELWYANLETAAADLTWEKEKRSLLRIFEQL